MAFFYENVTRVTDDCIVWPYAKTHGHGVVYIDGIRHYVHRLACELHHGPAPTADHVASHGDCHNRACFNGAHLSWQTRAEDRQDTKRDGTNTRGGSQEMADAIRARWAAGEQNKAALGREFGVSRTTIRDILTGKTWSV